MQELLRERRSPFVITLVIVALVTLAVFRLPETLITVLQNEGPLSISQRGWAFRLLAFMAVIQAAYVGFAILRIDRVQHAREKDPRVAGLTRERLMRSLGRNAAGAIFLTVIYGLAALASSGFRAGFWFFAFVAVVQGAWYYRETGTIARWLGFQPETVTGEISGVWVREPANYCPPLARGLQPITRD